MVFGAGQFRPDSSEGKRLIAHEAFHAAHQDSAGSVIPGIAPPDAPSEYVANRFANTLVHSRGEVHGWMAPSIKGAGPVWQVHPQRIVADENGLSEADLNQRRVLVKELTGTLPADATEEQADQIVALLAAYRSSNPASFRWLLLENVAGIEKWLMPFGFFGGGRYPIGRSALVEKFDFSIAVWRKADAKMRHGLRRLPFNGLNLIQPVSSGALETWQREVHAEQLEDGTYFEGTNRDLPKARAHARGNVVQQQIEGVVNSGPISLGGRVVGTALAGEHGGEVGAAIGSLGDAILPFLAAAMRTVGEPTPEPEVPPRQAIQPEAQSAPYVPDTAEQLGANRPDPPLSPAARPAQVEPVLSPSEPARSRPRRAPAGDGTRPGATATAKPLTQQKVPNPEETNLPPMADPLQSRSSADPHTPAPTATRRRGNTSSFLDQQLAIVSKTTHPLHVFVVETVGPDGTKSYAWRTTTFTAKSGRVMTGRYPGNEEGPVAQVGHADAFASGAREFLMLEDADYNQVSGQVIESRAKGASSHKIPVDVDGAIIDLSSLQQLERIGEIPKGTVAAARRIK